MLEAWNFQSAVWAAQSIISEYRLQTELTGLVISEVAPAPKVYMFFALFNCVG